MIGYIFKRLLLMIPTGIGIITIFFIISEFVPGGPLDQVEAMITMQADEGDLASYDEGSMGEVEIDPATRLEIKRRLGMNHSQFERYMRTLLWFSQDSLISSVELPQGTGKKVEYYGQHYFAYRSSDDQYRLYRNRFEVDGIQGEIMLDKKAKTLVSTLDKTVNFDPLSGVMMGGSGQLEGLEINMRTENFDEFEYLATGERVDVVETRQEMYLKAGLWAQLKDWNNWHGYFLLKFPYSVSKNKKCIDLIEERLPISMRLGIISFFLTYILCLILGIAKAVRNGTRFDAVSSVIVLIGFGMPGFVLAVFLLRMFGPGDEALLHLFPLRGLQSVAEVYETLGFWGKLWDNIHHLIAPIICLTIGSFAGMTMLTKNSILEEFQQLYAVAARARGLSKGKVLFKHVLRNSLVPLVTSFPSDFVMMFFGGAVLIEKIFSLDGLGLLGFTAVLERDFPLIMSNLFIFTYLGLFCKLLSDIGYVIVDPRISFEKSRS
jgi:microcin C transport system permease protein